MKFEAWGGTQDMGALFDANFESTLPATEAAVLNLSNDNEKKHDSARKLNALGMGTLALVMETPQMINMIALECSHDVHWPSGKFPTVWTKIKERFGPDDDMAVMDMEDDLHKIKLHKKNDPKDLLDDIAAVEVRYRCTLLPDKKAAVVVRTGKFDYAAVIKVTGTTVRGSKAQGATAEELVAEMHKQYCILGGRNKEASDDDNLKEMALSANSDIECYHCGQKGHKKNNCPKLRNQSGNNQGNGKHKGKKKFKGNCNHCGKPGLKRLIFEKNTQRRNQLNIGRMMPATLMWTFLSQILKVWTS